MELTTLSGNTNGNVILFEPSTSEHFSQRTIYDPITALAPAQDCQTYAIGYVVKAVPANVGEIDPVQIYERIDPASDPPAFV